MCRPVYHYPQPDGTPMKYGAIYIDPPWSFKNYSQKGEDKNPNQHYPCMKYEDMAVLPIGEMASDNCAMFMWIVDTHLPEALKLFSDYGFDYKTIAFIWDKDRLGLGYWTRKMAEVCLLATRGKPKRKNKDVRQILRAPIREHSRKPDLFYGRIESLVDGPYLEVFARQRRSGWDQWGNEVDKFTTEGKND